jgi:hypothetical protein
VVFLLICQSAKLQYIDRSVGGKGSLNKMFSASLSNDEGYFDNEFSSIHWSLFSILFLRDLLLEFQDYWLL